MLIPEVIGALVIVVAIIAVIAYLCPRESDDQ
jgi:hypothetical protein